MRKYEEVVGSSDCYGFLTLLLQGKRLKAFSKYLAENWSPLVRELANNK